MSIEAIAKAAKVTSLPSTTKFVLIAMSNYANDDGEAWPKQSTLAEWCSMSRETVLRHLAALEEMGYLSSQQRHYDDGRFASKVYRLEFLRADFQPCDSAPCDAQPCDGESQHRVSERHTDRVTENHNNNHHLEPSTVEAAAPEIEEPTAEQRADEFMRTGRNLTFEINRVRAKLRRLNADFAEKNAHKLANWAHHSDRELERLWEASHPDKWKGTSREGKRRAWNFTDLLSGEITPREHVITAASLRADLIREGFLSS